MKPEEIRSILKAQKWALVRSVSGQEAYMTDHQEFRLSSSHCAINLYLKGGPSHGSGSSGFLVKARRHALECGVPQDFTDITSRWISDLWFLEWSLAPVNLFLHPLNQ